MTLNNVRVLPYSGQRKIVYVTSASSHIMQILLIVNTMPFSNVLSAILLDNHIYLTGMLCCPHTYLVTLLRPEN